MDDLGAAEAPPEATASSSSLSGPTSTLPPTTTMLESPTGEKENADPLQVRQEIQVQFPSFASRCDSLNPSQARVGRQEAPSVSLRKPITRIDSKKRRSDRLLTSKSKEKLGFLSRSRHHARLALALRSSLLLSIGATDQCRGSFEVEPQSGGE